MTAALPEDVDRNTVRQFEQRAVNAWPSLETVEYDGWLLRFGAGYTRRSNSVNPLGGSAVGLRDKVQRCEEAYRSRGLPTIFKLHPAAEPTDLDDYLDYGGYEPTGVSLVQTLDLSAAQLPAADAQVRGSNALPDGWLDAYLALSGIDPRHLPTMEHLLRAIQPAARFVSFDDGDGASSAVGLGVLDQGFIGLFDIVTAAARRNQGVGRRLVSSLLRWGVTEGAHTAYLQVTHDNEAALHLYDRLGFRSAYRYWYRARPSS